MPSFVKDDTLSTPFGRNEYLRSTNPKPIVESRTLAADSWPTVTIDNKVLKIAQPGTVLAKITSGPDVGKVGPFQASGTKEVQTLTETGTISGGTFTLSFGGEVTAAIAYDATAAQVEAALDLLTTIQAVGGVAVTGGPIATAPFSVTFGDEVGEDVALLVADVALLTGSTPGIAVAEGTPGAAGATDGRGDTSNIVGLLDTFLPWQLNDGDDQQVGVTVNCRAVQAWCIEYDADGVAQPLGDTTAAAMWGTKSLDINFA